MHRLTTNAILVTRDGHWMKGVVSTDGNRILDVLNDPSRKYIKVQGLQISGCNSFTGVLARPEAWIQKSKLDLVVLTSDEHETPEKRWDNYAPKKRTRVTALAAGFEIEAYMHRASSTGDIQSTMESSTGCFLPLTAASISPLDPGTHPFAAGVVLVNKYCITLLANCEKQGQQLTESQARDRFVVSRPTTWDQSSETSADTHLN
jgi:hypothetical protein